MSVIMLLLVLITARKRSCGKVMFLHLSVILFTGGSLSRGCVCQGGLSPVGGLCLQGVFVGGGFLSRGFLSKGSLSRGGLCPGGGICLGGSFPGGSLSRGRLCLGGVSVEGCLCPEDGWVGGILCLGGLCQETSPYGKERAVRILLECILVRILTCYIITPVNLHQTCLSTLCHVI